MNMEFRRKLPGPEEVIQMYPVSEESKRQKAKNDEEIRKIFTGESDKLLLSSAPVPPIGKMRCWIIFPGCARCRKRCRTKL